jgi:hypothetical protein
MLLNRGNIHVCTTVKQWLRHLMLLPLLYREEASSPGFAPAPTAVGLWANRTAGGARGGIVG